MLLPLIIGLALGGGMARVESGPAAEDVVPGCRVTIILLPAGDRSGKAIDALTGSRGWSHALVDACERTSDGRRLAIDCRPGRGVHRVDLSTAMRPGAARIEIPIWAAGEMYGCLRARVGMPWHPVGMVATGGGYLVCSQFVYECLPRALRERVDQAMQHNGPMTGRPVAPNDLAVAFGARAGQLVKVE